jgi:lambda family phage portal protein
MGKRGNAMRKANRRASASALGFAPGSDTVNRAASSTDQALAAWQPANVEPNYAHASYEARAITDRARDLVANNAVAAAAVDRRVSMTVGLSLRYSARHELMAKRLNIAPDVASELASQIERAWESWACDPLFRCDYERDQPFGGLVNLAERHHFVDGEALGVMRFDAAPDWQWRTSLQLVDPDRLGNPMERFNDPKLINGIETDGRRAIAYHIREAHPGDWRSLGQQFRYERVPVVEPHGRPKVLHLRTKLRAGQKRGLSRFASCMKLFKQVDKYAEAELDSALLNALFGGFIKTTKTPGEAGESLGVTQLKELNAVRGAWYNGVNPRLSNGARLPVLAPGDDFSLNATPRHVASFQGFLTTALQCAAAPLGLASSQLTMDFSKTNFSSWRGEMLQVWRDVLQGRELVTTQFANLVLLCVIEEGIDNGDIIVPDGCPDLYENLSGWLAGRWIGPSRGTIDPGGEVDGAVKRMAAGLSTHEDEALELGGGDYQSIAGQLAWERDVWLAKNLTPTALREMLEAAPDPAPAPPPEPQPENAAAGNVVEPAV